MKVRATHVSMLAAALLLVGGGCATTEESTTATDAVGENEVAVMEDTAEVEMPVVNVEVEVVSTETFTEESGAYSYVYDPSVYRTQLYVSSKSVSLDQTVNNVTKTALQVFVKSADDAKLDPEVLANATSQTPVYAKSSGTSSVYAAKSSDGQILEIKCQAKTCDTDLKMLTVN